MKRIELSKLTKNVLKLPRLPVPTLDHTFDAYRRSVVALRPAESDEVKAHFTKLDTFLRQSAPSIQKNIVAKDKAAEEAGTYPFTYVESLLEHQFLKSRTPEVNMNSVFILKPDALKHVEKKEGASDHQIQAAAAARSLYAIGLWLQEVKAQGVPLPEEVSTFLTQQKNAVLTIDQILEGQLHESCIDLSPLHHEFGRSLIPAADVDEIKTTPIEELGHVVVLHDGFPYLLNIMDPADKSRTLSLEEIQKGLEYILSVTPETDNTTPVSVLTAASRTLWSKAYAELTKGEENAKNKEMLEKFHTAVLIVCLDSGKWSDHASLAESAALHGSKEELENRWYDKHQMIVSADGQLAFNFEASCSDRVHWAYWIEHVLRVANAAPPAVVKDDTTFDFTRLVQPLEITFGKSFAAHIRNARLEAHHIVEDLEVHSVHIPYGKEKIALLNEAEVNKGVRITPDAFAQLVLQLAHDTLRDRLTAASQLCSVANFFHGLTALARTMTAELAQVIHILNEMERKALPKLEAESEINLSNAGDGTVKPVAVALDSGKSFLASHITSTEDKQKLAAAMRAAITAHHGQVLAATRGEGIDRHMLVLDHHVRVNGDKAGLAFFEDELQKLSSSYLLSTSSFSREWLQYYTFGPQRENGYGLGYVIDRHEMRVSLTAFTNSPATNVSDLTSAILFYSDMVYHLLGGSK